MSITQVQAMTSPVTQGIVAIRRPTIGLLATIARDPLAAVPEACFRERLVLARNLGQTRAYLCDPALVQEALVRNADRLEKSADMKRVLGIALGDGLLSADGAAWRWQRQALAPSFQHDRLTTFLPAMIAAAELTRDRWIALPRGATIDVGHEMMRTTFQIIVETMLAGSEGIDALGVERSLSDYLAATPWMFALAMLRAPFWLPFPGRARAMSAIRFMRRAVADRVARRRRDGPLTGDLIGLLLAAEDPETGCRLDDAAITDNILTFIAAGHETTAVALSWTFALLAEHPACVEPLMAEISDVTGGGRVTPAHVGHLVYARQVISEAMRLYPPAPILARGVRREVVLDGQKLAAGSVLFVPVHAIHRHTRLWDQPDSFDPDRFAPEAVKARHRFAYMPFGAGPRVCIGNSFALMEAVAILAVLAQSLRPERVAPMPAARMRVTLRPATPLKMRVVR